MRTANILISSLFVATAGCASQSANDMADKGGKMAGDMVKGSWGPIAIAPKSGSDVKGTLTLTPVSNGVKVIVAIQGAAPGKHGIHIHEKADCSSDDGKSAGGHWNPKATDHALPPEEGVA